MDTFRNQLNNQTMLKIATHNSCTGEASKGLLSYLVLPFARCQRKTLYEQFQSGCRLFDIRAKLTSDGIYRPAHGFWTCKRTINDVLAELDHLAALSRSNPTYIMITYEGSTDYPQSFLTAVQSWMSRFPNLIFTEIAVKKPTWKVLKVVNPVSVKQVFKALNIHNWQMWFPVPYFWHLIYCRKHEFNDATFNMVDFL